jgi:hypothetical protein
VARQRTRLSLAAATAAALLVAGCGGEDVQQQAARELLEDHLHGRPGYTGDAHCTDAAANAIVVDLRTVDFVCAARLEEGGCDWWRVELLAADRARFAFYREDAGCTLPA